MLAHILFWLIVGGYALVVLLVLRRVVRFAKAWRLQRLQERTASIYLPPAKSVVPAGFEEPIGDPTCGWANDIEPYLHSELSRSEARRFWRHLMGCEHCLKKTIELQALHQENGLGSCARYLEAANLYGTSRRGRWVTDTFLHIETCLVCQAYILWLFGERRRDPEWSALERLVQDDKPPRSP